MIIIRKNETYKQLTITAGFILLFFLTTIITRTFNPLYPMVLFAGIIFLFCYFIKVIENIEYALPPIICLFWLVYFEPSPCDILAGITIAVFLINISIGRAHISKLSFSDVTLLTFLAFNAIGLLKSKNPSQSILHFIITFVLIFFYFCLSRIVKSYKQVDKLMKFYTVASLITAFLMICQWHGIGQSLLFAARDIFESIQSLTGSLIPFYSGRKFMWWGRCNAFFKDSNVAAAFLIPAIIFSLAMIFHKKRRYKYYILHSILCTVAIFFALSRGAVACLLLGIVLISLLSLNLRNIASITIITILLIGSVLTIYSYAPTEFARLSDTKTGIQRRLTRIERSLHTIKENPLAGVGPFGSPHDTYLARFTQAGIIGGLSFLSFFGYLILKLFLKYRRNKDNISEKNITLTLLIILITFIPLGFVIDTIHWRHFWFFCALSSVVIRID